MEDDCMTLKEFAGKLKLSPSTIYKNPPKYYMFKVGGSWRANKESLKKFEQAQFNDNNVYRLAVVGGRRNSKCRSTKEGVRSGLMSHLQVEKELGDLLAPRTR